MLYLSGAISTQISASAHRNVGSLLTPFKGNCPMPNRPFAGDTGCYTQGALPQDDARWVSFGRRVTQFPGCLFVPAFDVVGSWEDTLKLFWGGGRSAIAALGTPVAIVLQDGCTEQSVPWDAIDAVFVGGTTAFKLASAPLIKQAKLRGKWAHVGRVNGWKRLLWAWLAGADSVDGTHLAFRPTHHLRQLNGWLDRLDKQMMIGESCDLV